MPIIGWKETINIGAPRSPADGVFTIYRCHHFEYMTFLSNILRKENIRDSNTDKYFDPEVTDITSIHILLTRTGHTTIQRLGIFHAHGSQI